MRLDQAAPIPKLGLDRLSRRAFDPEPERKLCRSQDLRVDPADIANDMRDGCGRGWL
jgi:hypothetical protein